MVFHFVGHPVSVENTRNERIPSPLCGKLSKASLGRGTGAGKNRNPLANGTRLFFGKLSEQFVNALFEDRLVISGKLRVFCQLRGCCDCFSFRSMFGSNTAQLGALEVQMVICGLPISGSSSVPARTPIMCNRASL